MARGRADTGQAETFAGRLDRARAQATKLAATRAAIFREELAEKGLYAVRAIAGFVVALFFVALALLVATGLVAALFSKLLGSVILGVAATLVLCLAVAAAGALLGVRAMHKVAPTRFPVTADAIKGDLSALSAAVSLPPAPTRQETGADDLQARFRAGSE